MGDGGAVREYNMPAEGKQKMKKEQKNNIREWLYITAGILIMTAGIYFFKFPNHFSTGGVTGIAIILGHYIPSITPPKTPSAPNAGRE